MSRRFSAQIFVAACLAATSVVARAQERGHDWWVSMGGGVATQRGIMAMAAGVDYGYRFEESSISVRIIGATNNNPTVKRISPSIATTNLTDYGILYGPFWRSGEWRFSVGGGIGLVRTNETTGAVSVTRSSFSVPVEGQIFRRLTHFAGAGLYGYVSVNGVRTFGGALLVVQLGEFGPAE